MKKAFSFLAVAVIMAAARAESPLAVPEGIGFYGNFASLEQSSSALPMSLVFKLYDAANPTVALWGRRISVKVATTGNFYVELRDDVGVSVMSTTITLADAMSKIVGTPEIGLTPPDAEEFAPRFRLATSSRATRAAIANAVGKLTVKGTLGLGTVQATRVTVSGNLTAGSALFETARVSLGSEVTSLATAANVQSELLGGIRGIHDYSWAADAVPEETSTRCDRIDTFQSPNGLLFAFPMPKGTRLNPSSALRLHRQAFGRQ